MWYGDGGGSSVAEVLDLAGVRYVPRTSDCSIRDHFVVGYIVARLWERISVESASAVPLNTGDAC